MNVTGHTSQSNFYPSPLRDRGSESALIQRKQRLETEQDQRKQVSQPVGEKEQAKEGRKITRVGSLQAASKQYDVRPVLDFSKLPNSQQKALQAYAETDIFSRIDGNTDFLGAIDVFV